MTTANVFPDSDVTESKRTEGLSPVSDRADTPVSEITERFFRAIVAKVPLDGIEELHLFSPLRQGGVETGIAVIAARASLPMSVGQPLELALESVEIPVEGDDQPNSDAIARHTVYTARYRLVQKGAERGKWEANVVDEADAPLVTVEMVVRGVQRRAGEASETVRYSGAQIARALRL